MTLAATGSNDGRVKKPVLPVSPTSSIANSANHIKALHCENCHLCAVEVVFRFSLMEFMPSENEYDSVESNVENYVEEEGEESNENEMEEAPPKKRRMAGDRSGRQLALRRLQKGDSDCQIPQNMPILARQ